MEYLDLSYLVLLEQNRQLKEQNRQLIAENAKLRDGRVQKQLEIQVEVNKALIKKIEEIKEEKDQKLNFLIDNAFNIEYQSDLWDPLCKNAQKLSFDFERLSTSKKRELADILRYTQKRARLGDKDGE
jgi:hypothetical protein